MPPHAALLRGINLGNRRVKMDELRGHFEDLGLTDAETYLASGNVVFGHSGSDLPGLERRVEAHLQEALGYEVATFVRPPTIWEPWRRRTTGSWSGAAR